LRARVAGPNHSHFAPVRDCSLLDTCSRCYTRIAPWLTSSACVVRGLRRAQHFSASHHSRIAPRSILGLPHRARRSPCGLLRARCFPPCAAPVIVLADRSFLSVRSRCCTFCLGVCAGFLPAPRRAPRTVRELLRARHLTVRIASGALLADCSSLDASRPALPADCSARASLSARTVHKFLRARHLAFRIAPGSFLADRSVLVASRPALLADCSALNA